ncbi:F-box protein [Achlya hypogyna]|uniref:F-box protein n=1 Tax=Achlya hypogyna TaxID=1202772 RepID=A0A1V9ZJC0_ACHHY|nr:F-box protein [Achlya hypogyna]
MLHGNQDDRPSTSSGRKNCLKTKTPKKEPQVAMQYADKLTGLMGNERNQLAQQVLIAAEKGSTKAIYLLLHQGISPGHCIGMQGYSPLHHAATRGHLEIARLLVQFGWPLNQPNKFGEAALHLACHGGHFAIAEFLLDKGAEINALTHDGETALFFAARKGHFRVVRLLLRREVDWTVRNRFDDVAEDEAKDDITRAEFAAGQVAAPAAHHARRKESMERLLLPASQRGTCPFADQLRRAATAADANLHTRHRERIFSFLPLADLGRALQVCCRWQRAADAPQLWVAFKVSRWELSLGTAVGLGVVAPMSGYRPRQAAKPRPSTSGAELFPCALGFHATTPTHRLSCSKAESQRRPQTAIVVPITLASPRGLHLR